MGADKEAAQKAVEALVAHYQARARAVSRTGVGVGAFVGAAVGSIPLSPLHAAWPIPSSYGFATLLGGLVVGVLIGYVIGDPRAKLYQRMAEQARLQLELEQRLSQNDARMAQLLTALTARAAATARQAQSPAPEPRDDRAPSLPPVQHVHPVQQVPAQPTLSEPPFAPAAPPPRLRTVTAGEPAQTPPLSPPNAYDTGTR